LVPTVLASLQGLLNGTRQPLWEVAAQVLGAILGRKQFRIPVWEEEQCISGLAQYWAISCLWLLTFEPLVAENIDK
jgi:V-type H+-transporting ATPase subunit H